MDRRIDGAGGAGLPAGGAGHPSCGGAGLPAGGAGHPSGGGAGLPAHTRLIPIPTATLPPYTETNAFLVCDGGEAVLVDAGVAGPDGEALLLDAWTAAGQPRLTIVLTHTHPDHTGGVLVMQQRTGARVLVHEAERERLADSGLTELSTVADGDELTVGTVTLRVLHVPGHSPGHISLWEPQSRLLFTGDNVLGGDGTSWIGPPDGNMADYLASLERCLALQPAALAPGHGPVVTEATARIKALIEHRLAREEQLVALLGAGPASVAALAEAVYAGRVDRASWWVAEATVAGHLEKLVRDGRVREEAGVFRLV